MLGHVVIKIIADTVDRPLTYRAAVQYGTIDFGRIEVIPMFPVRLGRSRIEPGSRIVESAPVEPTPFRAGPKHVRIEISDRSRSASRSKVGVVGEILVVGNGWSRHARLNMRTTEIRRRTEVPMRDGTSPECPSPHVKTAGRCVKTAAAVEAAAAMKTAPVKLPDHRIISESRDDRRR